jgi:hypothetical protein
MRTIWDVLGEYLKTIAGRFPDVARLYDPETRNRQPRRDRSACYSSPQRRALFSRLVKTFDWPRPRPHSACLSLCDSSGVVVGVVVPGPGISRCQLFPFAKWPPVCPPPSGAWLRLPFSCSLWAASLVASARVPVVFCVPPSPTAHKLQLWINSRRAVAHFCKMKRPPHIDLIGAAPHASRCAFHSCSAVSTVALNVSHCSAHLGQWNKARARLASCSLQWLTTTVARATSAVLGRPRPRKDDCSSASHLIKNRSCVARVAIRAQFLQRVRAVSGCRQKMGRLSFVVCAE